MTNSNKHIALVKKWIEDNDSVSHEQLQTNDTHADAAYDAASASTSGSASAAAYAASAAWAADTDAADHWVKRYEELTNEK